jgi:hypothetical protein
VVAIKKPIIRYIVDLGDVKIKINWVDLFRMQAHTLKSSRPKSGGLLERS